MLGQIGGIRSGIMSPVKNLNCKPSKDVNPPLRQQLASGWVTKFALVTAAAALRIVPPPMFRRAKKGICKRRFLIAVNQAEFGRAERILTTFARSQAPSLALISRYIGIILNQGQAENPHRLIAAAGLDPEHRTLLQGALLVVDGKPEEALATLNYEGSNFEIRHAIAIARRSIHRQLRSHEAHAIEGVAFLKNESSTPLIRFAVSVAGSAEASNREDLFRFAITRVLSDRDRVVQDEQLFAQFWKDAELACMTAFDLDGALAVLLKARSLGMSQAKDSLIDLLLVREEARGLEPIVTAARDDLLRRAGLLQPLGKTGDVAVILPIAAFRVIPIDYPGFRADIRFVMKCIVSTLDECGIRYVVKSRVWKRGKVNLTMPFFSYHTVSDGPKGLHFKESDRPSRFICDNRGYAGWSAFSNRSIADLQLNTIDLSAAETFFRREQSSIIGGNISKYAQAPLVESEGMPERYVFVGLQVLSDAVQELALASPFAMIDEVVAVCEKLEIETVVKRHPCCDSPQIGNYLKEMVDKGKIRLSEASIHELIQGAEAVCVVNSGVGAEALLHEKPVYLFGRADYMAACFLCHSPGEFKRIFVPGRLPVSMEDLHRFWYVFRHEYSVDLSDRVAAQQWIAERVRRHALDQLAIVSSPDSLKKS